MAQVAVVTGASRGIGAETAVRLARAGFDVCVAYRANADAAQSVVATCMASGARAVAVACEISDDRDVERLFSYVDATLGTLQVLVNNAGIVAARSRVEDMDRDRLMNMMAVNVVGPFLCAKQAVRRMSNSRGGSGGVIVNVSSAASRLGSPGEYVDYAASKGALDTMTIGLSREVAREGIRVNAVRPGLIETEIHASGGQPDRLSRLSSSVPMQRPGTAGEVSEAIVWLCSEAASYVTGALLDVGGGR